MCSSGGEEYDSTCEYNTAGPAYLNGSTNNNTHFDPFSSLMPQSHHQNPNYNFFFNPPPNYLHAPSQSSIHLPHPPANESVGGGWHDANDDDGVGKAKKRNRAASRRAPTTVITTDTSNFRSMVREFTGIPSPPSSLSRRFHPFRPSPRHLHPPNPSFPFFPSSPTNTNNHPPHTHVLDPLSSSHQDLGFAFQTPLPTTFIGSKFQPSSGSDCPVNVTGSSPSHF